MYLESTRFGSVTHTLIQNKATPPHTYTNTHQFWACPLECGWYVHWHSTVETDFPFHCRYPLQMTSWLGGGENRKIERAREVG